MYRADSARIACRSCLGLPPQEFEELSEDHRRCPPDFDASDMECRYSQDSPVARALGLADRRGVQEIVEFDLENARDLAVRRRPFRLASQRAHDRMQAEAADGDVERCQRAEH